MEPTDEIQIIRRSVRCFTCGLIGALPGIGVPFAVVALGDFLYVSQNKGAISNPAERYRRWGAFGAIVGLLVTMFLAAIIAAHLWWNV
jgi:hypothetical protein